MEATTKLTVSFESTDIEDIIAAVDQMRESLVQEDRTMGMPQPVRGVWELRSGSWCEYCRGEGEVAHDEDDGEGHIMRGVDIKKCSCQKQN